MSALSLSGKLLYSVSQCSQDVDSVITEISLLLDGQSRAKTAKPVSDCVRL